MVFVTDNNRPQPLRQPPPTACLTASGAASGAPSLLMHPWAGVCIPLVRSHPRVLQGQAPRPRPPDSTAAEADRVRQILETVAGAPAADPDATLLGLPSLKLMEVSHHLRVATGKTVGLLDLMHLNVPQLVAHVAALPSDTPSPSPPPSPAGAPPPPRIHKSWVWLWSVPCSWLARLPKGTDLPALRRTLRRLAARQPQLTALPLQETHVSGLTKEVAGLCTLWALQNVAADSLRSCPRRPPPPPASCVHRPHWSPRGRCGAVTAEGGAAHSNPDPPHSFASQPSISGVGGGSDNPPPSSDPPLLSHWAIFSPGLWPIKNFLWRLRRKSV